MKGYATLPNCVTCGRFCTQEPGLLSEWNRTVARFVREAVPEPRQIGAAECIERQPVGHVAHQLSPLIPEDAFTFMSRTVRRW